MAKSVRQDEGGMHDQTPHAHVLDIGGGLAVGRNIWAQKYTK